MFGLVVVYSDVTTVVGGEAVPWMKSSLEVGTLSAVFVDRVFLDLWSWDRRMLRFVWVLCVRSDGWCGRGAL